MPAVNRFLLVVIVIVTVAAPLLARQAAPGHDAQLEAEITRKIAGLKLEPSHVVVSAHDGVVLLEGTVPTLWVKRQAIEAARKTTGITEVDSTLEIARSENDGQLAAAVIRVLQRYPRMTVYDYIGGTVRNGVVALEGVVTDPTKSEDVIESIEKIPGVQDLANNVKLLPVSPEDDRIRVTIANRIYSDSLFVNYSLANPPIHVIVEHGHVTLVGIVASDIERRKAVAVARAVPGVFSVDNQIHLSSDLPH